MQIAARDVGRRVQIRLEDDGAGVPEESLATITGRGVRLDEKAGGQGLGLAIAADIAEAAQGSLLLQNGAQGLIAVLDLPKAGAFERW